MLRRIVLALLGFSLLFSLVSCIEGEEEIWLNADASGYIKYKANFPLLLLDQLENPDNLVEQVQLADKNNDNITIHRLETRIDGNRFFLEIELSFTNALQLGEFFTQYRDLSTPHAKSIPEALIGNADVQIQFPHLICHRKVDPSNLIPEEIKNPLTQSLLGDSSLTYTLHLPEPVKTHDADFLSPDRKTLKWTFPVSTLLEGPVEMNFKSSVPNFSRYLSIIIGLLTLGCITIVAWLQFRKRKRRALIQ